MNEELILQLRDISHKMRNLYEGKGSQQRILIILDKIDEKITQRALTARLGIQPGSASEVINKLETAGYIKKTINETDRRTADIELTLEGKEAARQAKQQRLARHQEMFACLSDEEKQELLRLLEKINHDWQERYPVLEEHKKHHYHKKHR